MFAARVESLPGEPWQNEQFLVYMAAPISSVEDVVRTGELCTSEAMRAFKNLLTIRFSDGKGESATATGGLPKSR